MSREYNWLCVAWSVRGCYTNKPCRVYAKANEPVDCLEGFPQAICWRLLTDKEEMEN